MSKGYVPFLPPNCECGAGIGGIHTEECAVYKWMVRNDLLHRPEKVLELYEEREARAKKDSNA